MYWNRKAVTGQFDGFIMSKPKNCDGRFAGFMSWNRKAVTGQFDRLYYVETEKNVTERYAGLMYCNRKAVTGQFDSFIMSKPKKL